MTVKEFEEKWEKLFGQDYLNLSEEEKKIHDKNLKELTSGIQVSFIRKYPPRQESSPKKTGTKQSKQK